MSPQQQAALIRRRHALAEAIAGVVATLVSLWTFYPIDVLKTKLQAGVESKSPTSSSLLNGLFRGLPLKTLHAASSSFCYFYLYSFIASWWTQRQAGSKKMSPAVRLSLSAVAAMMNTFLTLPLDVLASKKQAATHDGNTSKEASNVDETQEDYSEDGELEGLTLVQKQQAKMDQIWNNLQQNTTLNEDVQEGDVFYDSCSEAPPIHSKNATNSYDSDELQEEKTQDHNELAFRPPHLKVTVTTTTTQSDENKLLHFEPTSLKATREQAGPSAFSQALSLWKGLYPSLLLCSNPSIHYTVFDMAKSHLLQTKTTTSTTTDHLSMAEAFVLGLFAKFCATIATYPLIRAKVMLMVTSRNCMFQTLVENYQRDGIANGWYKGCSVQLLHTVLKSALLMMLKERISTTTHRLLVPPQSQPSPAHSR